MNRVNKKNGFVSIEAVLFGSAIAIVFFILVGFFSYIYPSFVLQREVGVLTRQAQQNGGLTTENVSEFKNKVNKYKFVKESGKEVVITAKTSPSNYNAIVSGNSYISRDSDEVIDIEIKIPTDNRIIKKFTDKSSDYYIFKSSVMSERL